MESVTGFIELDTLVIEESEQSISMPDMVADLEFEQVNIDIDFQSNFDVPIRLLLELFGRDSSGNDVLPIIMVDQYLSADNDFVHIDATEILNNHPATIVSSGQARIGGGDSVSTITNIDEMNPVMYINVPLSLIIDDPPFLDMDVTSVDTIIPEDEGLSVNEFVLFADVLNLFEFGATVVVLASDDSMTFDSLTIAAGNADIPDTLLSLILLPLENATPETQTGDQEIILSEEKINLFKDKLFLKPEVQLLGRTIDGVNVPSRFFTTDSLSVRVWGSATYTIEGEEF